MIIPGIFGTVAAGRPAASNAGFQAAAASITNDSTLEEIKSADIHLGVVGGSVVTEGSLHCAVSGNVDWLQVELADVQSKRGAASALAYAYRKLGPDLLSAAGGRFVMFVWDEEIHTGFVSCDRFGQIPVFWSDSPNGELALGPTATAVAHVRGERPALSEQSLFNYLYFHMVPGPATAFQGISKLMAAHVLTFASGRWTPRRYWEPDFREHADASLSDAAEEMMGLLSSSVARLAADSDSGAFLSGGLDSSTVAGLLARHHPKPKTYSIGFDADGYDEIAYAKLASERFDTVFKTYYVTPEDVLAELPRIAGAYDEPFGNSSALPAFFCAQFAASDGRKRLLAGDGGDELFAGNERYAKQTVFERYRYLPKWGRKHILEPLLGKIPKDGPSLLSKAQSYVEQANVPLPERLQSYNFINRLGAQRIVSPDLLEAVDMQVPLELDRALYHAPYSATQLNRMLYLDWHHTLTDNDLRKVNRMCQLAGIEVEYPMLDDRLVEFSTRVSSSRKMRGNRLRTFYKHAVADFLPEQILNKPKHGFGLPFGVWMAEHKGLQELANDNLARMRRRNYVRADFIDEITRLHREQHASYYGEFIWVMIMLELWLTAQGYEP